MPVARFEMEDGRIARFEVPEGTTPEQAQSMIMASLQTPQAPTGGSYEAIGEPAMTMISGALAQPLSGLYGMGAAVIPGGQTGAEAVETAQEALTYQPRTQAGQSALQSVGGALEPVATAFESTERFLGDTAFELTGSPEIAAAAATSPTLLLELLGVGALRKMTASTRLLDDAGRPTKALRKALEQQGLDFDSLTPQAKALIPQQAEKGLIVSSDASRPAQKALVEQIKRGGRENALAGLKVVSNEAVPDRAAIEAMRQGYSPGFVQAVKTASPATRKEMDKMLTTMRRIKKNERLALETRPSNMAGDVLTERLMFIRDQANRARIELDDIANKSLRGVDIDVTPVLSQLERSLGDLDIRLVDTPSGVPRPVFEGSLISADRTSQRIIKDAIRLMSEGGAPDALRFHKLKRQLDALIDFNKKSSRGLTDAGKGVLKDIRRSLNQSVRQANPDYARVNDILSRSLDTIDSLDSSVGTIDIFGKNANKALGTRLRALMSNQQSRIPIENALDEINATVNAFITPGTNIVPYTGKSASKAIKAPDMSIDLKDLVMFADGLDDRFGSVARTSLGGELQKATTQGMQQGAKATMVQQGAEAVGKGAEKLRGINDFNAFEAMLELLKNQP